MNIFQLSLKTEIPLFKLRRLQKIKALIVDEESDFLDALAFHMRGNKALTAAQLLTLIEAPDLLADLKIAKPRYAKRAQEQILALGAMSDHAPPRDVTAAILGASRGDDDESLIIANWLKTILPADPVLHAWIAVRLLKPLNTFMREQSAPLISPALLNMRKLPEFAGWWRSEKIGARSVIRYFRPALDL